MPIPIRRESGNGLVLYHSGIEIIAAMAEQMQMNFKMESILSPCSKSIVTVIIKNARMYSASLKSYHKVAMENSLLQNDEQSM